MHLWIVLTGQSSYAFSRGIFALARCSIVFGSNVEIGPARLGAETPELSRHLRIFFDRLYRGERFLVLSHRLLWLLLHAFSNCIFNNDVVRLQQAAQRALQ
jgi:hypothetical protein